jgi:hypothetical protein
MEHLKEILFLGEDIAKADIHFSVARDFIDYSL